MNAKRVKTHNVEFPDVWRTSIRNKVIIKVTGQVDCFIAFSERRHGHFSLVY